MNEPVKEVNASVKGSRLHALVCTNEWSEFEKLVQDIYQTNLTLLIESENPEARGAIKCIDSMMSKLYDDIRFGDRCRGKVTEFYKNKGA